MTIHKSPSHRACWINFSNFKNRADSRDASAAGQLVGADYGDEAAKVCERVWKEQKPDMVCNFTTGSTEFMTRGLDRAKQSHVPFVVIVSASTGPCKCGGSHRAVSPSPLLSSGIQLVKTIPRGVL